jgi:glutathione synthase
MSRSIKLGFVVNDMATEQDNYTTVRLARTAANRGHEVAIIGLGGFIYDANGTVRAKAHMPRGSDYADDARPRSSKTAPGPRTAGCCSRSWPRSST